MAVVRFYYDVTVCEEDIMENCEYESEEEITDEDIIERARHIFEDDIYDRAIDVHELDYKIN